MNNEKVPDADTLKSRSRGISQDMSPDAINRRLDIVDEHREFACHSLVPIHARRGGRIRTKPHCIETCRFRHLLSNLRVTKMLGLSLFV
jgi:hypothetical protein